MQKDTNRRLQAIRTRSGRPLYHKILETQTNILTNTEKISKIRCVELKEDQLRRDLCADPIALHYVRPHLYIAISCPWEVPSPDHIITGKYHIDLDAGMNAKVMPQDAVLNRVISYANSYDMPFWIDKLCIDQLEGCNEKKVAIQSMDLVYANSSCTVGLLFMRIDAKEQVEHLHGLLSGNCVVARRLERDGSGNYELNIPLREARAVLDVIELILKDAWWQRGWIFQEEYLSTTRMRLLIRSSQAYGLDATIFGKITGELEVNAIEFRKAITHFCLAYLRRAKLPPIERRRCRYVLDKAGRYGILLTQNEQEKSLVSMSPTILREIGARDIKFIADVLAIAANSCGYSQRLDLDKMNRSRTSLSLAILTPYVLNGEILAPCSASLNVVLAGDIFQFLSKSALRLEPPLGLQQRGLTFAKHCRFMNVKLSRKGIGTNGIICKLKKPINAMRYALPKYIRKKVWNHSLWKSQQS